MTLWLESNPSEQIPLGVEATEHMVIGPEVARHDLPPFAFVQSDELILKPNDRDYSAEMFPHNSLQPTNWHWYFTSRGRSACYHNLPSCDHFSSISSEHLNCPVNRCSYAQSGSTFLKANLSSSKSLNSLNFYRVRSFPIISHSSEDEYLHDGDCTNMLRKINSTIASVREKPLNSPRHSSFLPNFYLDDKPQMDLHGCDNLDETRTMKRLCLPGSSGFEDGLIRDVAHFELCEYMIGELERVNQVNSLECMRSNTAKLHTLIDSSTSESTVARVPTLSSVELQPSHSLMGFLQTSSLFTEIPNDKSALVAHPNSGYNESPADDVICPPSVNSATAIAVDLISAFLSNLTVCEENEDCIIELADLQRFLLQTSDLYWACNDFKSTTGINQLCLGNCSNDYQIFNTFSPPPPVKLNQSRSTSVDFQYNANATIRSQYSAHSSSLTISQLLVQNSPSLSYSSLITKRRSRNPNLFIKSLNHPISTSLNTITVTEIPATSFTTFNGSIYPQLNHISNTVTEKNFPSSSQLTKYTTKSHSSNSRDPIHTQLHYGLLLCPPIAKSKRTVILSTQRNRCAGCGLFIESRYLKRMRFCEFFGRFYCCVCHSNTLMTLPGNLLSNWDFRMLPVCNVARDRLTQLHHQPLFWTKDFNQHVVTRHLTLLECRTLRNQGNLMLPFIKCCPDAQTLASCLEVLPKHWLKTPDLWSISDLHDVRDGKMAGRLHNVLQPIVEHFLACVRCKAHGFICEVCHSGQILFPFGQPNTTTCTKCSACFHHSCLRDPKPETCPRCIRRSVKQSSQSS